ncbi:MAG TPA: F0F1 ATP synthase subunit epsilon [Actinomycetes bacterium]|nr:F0F1 ATP synthase subunit epsilon [Actinomycetes bacterium]
MALQVQLVAADRPVWSGEATIVIARTVGGDIGVMPGHEPVLGELASGVVLVRTTDGGVVHAAIHGGFISVENDIVSLLAEQAELAEEIDLEHARREFERLEASGVADEDLSDAQKRAETRLRAAEARIH